MTELQQKVVQRCLQLHGGHGFVKEYDVALDYPDCRGSVLRAGATEIIGRKLTRQ